MYVCVWVCYYNGRVSKLFLGASEDPKDEAAESSAEREIIIIVGGLPSTRVYT